MTAKEQKAFMELGQTLGYEEEDLRRYVAQCIEAERAQKEADRALEREKATIAAEQGSNYRRGCRGFPRHWSLLSQALL